MVDVLIINLNYYKNMNEDEMKMHEELEGGEDSRESVGSDREILLNMLPDELRARFEEGSASDEEILEVLEKREEVINKWKADREKRIEG